MGAHFVSLVLFANLIFVNTSGKEKQSRHEITLAKILIFLTSLSRCAFFICKVDIAIIYLTAAISKLQGDLWINGVAIYYILQVDEFYHPFWTNLIINSDFLITFLTYSSIAWELCYPLLIWVRACRIPLVFIAIVFHFGTVIVMGLTTFGIGMILWNFIMLKDRDILLLKNLLLQLKQKTKKKYFSLKKH